FASSGGRNSVAKLASAVSGPTRCAACPSATRRCATTSAVLAEAAGLYALASQGEGDSGSVWIESQARGWPSPARQEGYAEKNSASSSSIPGLSVPPQHSWPVVFIQAGGVHSAPSSLGLPRAKISSSCHR